MPPKLNRPCKARHPDPARTAGTCHLCKLATTDGRYQRLWNLPVTAPDGPHHTGPRNRQPRIPLPCDHEEPVIEWAPCGSQLKHVRGCEVHDRCCRGPTNGAVKSCQSCTDYARPPIRRRNLLFHLLPVPDKWQWHIEPLMRRAPLFNGRKIMAICTGPNLDPPEVVAQRFPGFEIITAPNNPDRREVVTFEPLFSKLDAAPDEVTLYAQGKGVTRNPGLTVFRWTEILYETLCDYWPVVEGLLDRYPVAGSFLHVGKGWAESESDWFYSGSWFWFRNHDLFTKPDWRRIDQIWTGIEPYPSLHFPVEEAGVVFHRGKVGVANLYDWNYLRESVEPPYSLWKQRHADRRTEY